MELTPVVLDNVKPNNQGPSANHASRKNKELFANRLPQKFWLALLIVVMLMLGALTVFGQSFVVAPFIYTLF